MAQPFKTSAAHSLDIDVGHASSELSLHELLAAVLHFPGWYGKNFDGLEESISDPEQSQLPTELVLRTWDVLERRLPRAASLLGDIFKDLAAKRPIVITAYDESGNLVHRWAAPPTP